MKTTERLEVTVTRKRTDYFWGLLFDSLNNRVFWLAVLIPPVAEGVLHFQRTESDPIVARMLQIATHVAGAAGIVAAVVVAIYYFAAGLSARAPGHLAPTTYLFSATGVSPHTEPNETAWIAYRSVVETNALFVLRQKMSGIQIIPKRDLSTQAIANLRRLLRQSLGRRAQVKESAA